VLKIVCFPVLWLLERIEYRYWIEECRQYDDLRGTSIESANHSPTAFIYPIPTPAVEKTLHK
jgi:hypothetical protein